MHNNLILETYPPPLKHLLNNFCYFVPQLSIIAHAIAQGTETTQHSNVTIMNPKKTTDVPGVLAQFQTLF